MTNPCGKTRPKSNPYEVWEVPGLGRHLVLKKYQSPEGEAKNPQARWLVFVDNEYGETGDTYAHDVMKYGHLVERDGQPV